MVWGAEHDAVRAVVVDYLEGMCWGDEAKLRRAFHPGALQVGHFGETYEFFPLEEFIAWLKGEETEVEGSPIVAELLSIEVTGKVAVAKLTDTCFGTDFTDYLVMVKDRPDAQGRWQIVTKAYHVHAGRGLPPGV
ncbi:MAG: nuclear transport factor 2 family protein [Tabrizicola flagellatus]|uniref:nuclear transport factor 2 family protein n=1 Tax=Tabrizicola flagellatus TaxID=2593021 RepID=UPI003918ACB4